MASTARSEQIEAPEDAPDKEPLEAGGAVLREIVRSASRARKEVVLSDDEASADSEGESRKGLDEENKDAEPSGGGTGVDKELDSSAANHFEKRVRLTQARGSILSPAKQVDDLSGFLGSVSDPVDLLPVLAGWLEKARPGWFGAWQRRWFVLSRKQLQWFRDKDEKLPLGILDFDLVSCEVECLWDKKASSAGQSPKTRGACGGCDPLVMVNASLSKVCFRVCPVGSDRAFELRAASLKEGNAWVETLAKHIEVADATASTMQRVPTGQLTTFGHQHWWKVRRISPEQFVKIALTGDILLFRSEGAAPKIIRAASGGRFDHVALILKLADGQVGLFEATGNLGVGLCTWEEFIENDWQSLYPQLALRRVRFPRTGTRLAALEAWCTEVNGKPYSLSVAKLKQRQSVAPGAAEAGDGSFFCSELAAEALKVLGVIPRGSLSSTQFWPSTFEASQKMPIELSPDCSMGEELTIDFSLGATRPRVATEAAGKNRDATTNW